ncbi:sulfatase-like hydrolase/transferase [Oceaniferula spumae]
MRSFLAFLLLTSVTSAGPISSSWFTDFSGQYARVYPTTAEESAGVARTTWDHPTGNDQLAPTYAGVSEISTTATDLYIRTSGLAFQVMGPWYLNEAKTNLFPNYPGNIAQSARFPLTPVIQGLPKTLTPGGAIGYFVDGVAMFDSRDAFSYSLNLGRDAGPGDVPNRGDGIWNRDAYVNESVTFDPANSHSAGETLHYHANPAALRNLLGDSVDYDPSTNTYTENPNGKHSPILAWTFDGLPLYGPYGYSDPLDSASGVRRMISGYQMRDGSNGSTNLAATGRTTLPTWITRNESARNNPLTIQQYGPAVNATYTLGRYLEDYDYKGDRGLTHGVDFDLNEYNVRWCVTPEFPAGTWAYFSCIAADGTPVFPYNISRYYYGTPSGGNVNNLPAERTIIFEGGPEAKQQLETPEVSGGDVTITWSGAEGGTYRIEHSDDLENWKLLDDESKNDEGSYGSLTDAGRAVEPRQFYRSQLTSIAPFDDAGFDYAQPQFATFSATFSPLPPLSEITSVTVGGLSATILGSNNGKLELSFDDASLAPASYNAVLTYTPSGGSSTQLTSTNAYTIAPPRNILLLILDDWGIDSSPIDNQGNLNASLPSMPNLETLAARGVRFTNAYAQPVCSPTRASIITGRYGIRNGVGHPTSNTLATSEVTLPEVFTAQSSGYSLASFGKWHLGGGNDGPSTLGGWPEFRGILGGGVGNYYNWSKTINGTTTAGNTTYTTTDQVNDAVNFINAQGSTPWFVWIGFNAPHTPFHNPPAHLKSSPDYPVDANNEITGVANRRPAYNAALQALDTEIGRLLESVDLSNTNIILIGDNGTPGQVIQSPFSNGHAKDTLYQGGIHVPLVIAGPDVEICGTSKKQVHCVDLFSTILDLARLTEPSGVDLDSQSLLPILKGRDVASRAVVSERFNSGSAGDGRSIILAEYPDYKLIAFGDPTDGNDATTYEMYQISSDTDEQTPLAVPPVSTDLHYAAYMALIAKDLAIGPPPGAGTVLYLELPTTGGPSGAPPNPASSPDTITVNGTTATFVARFNQSDVYDQYWVKCTVPASLQAPYTTATITFPNNPNTGDTRVFTIDGTKIFTAP